MLTLNKKRLFALFSLVAIFGAFITAVLIPNTAMADVKDTPYLNEVYNDKLYKDLSAHQHYWWLYSCFQNVNIDKVTESEVDGWDFFEGNGMISGLGAMYTASKDNGAYRRCNDANMVKTAFNYLGFTDSRKTFCTIPGAQYKEGGGKSSDYDDCIAGAGKGNWDNNDEDRNDIMAWYKSKVHAKKPTLTNPARYMRAMASLVNGCDIQFNNDTLYNSAAEVPGADDGSDGTKYAVPVVVKLNGGYKVKYVLGIGIAGDRSVIIAAASGGASGSSGPTQTADCNQLVNAARDTADSYATFIQRAGATNESEGENQSDKDINGDEGTTSCAIDGIGWLVCPVVRFTAHITDASYTVVSAMLTVQPLSTNTSNNDTYKAWSVMRNIANIAFVIAFLLIIYSQMTSVGISNYGIKKMLPKLIVAAILVNVSYWVCAIAVDISNILGSSIKDLIGGLNADLINEDAQSGQGSWSKLAAVILVAGIALIVGLSAFLPLLIIALMAIVTVLIVLTLRQGLIILLIVIAPLAFVANLLPNTEQWFKKWMGLFQILLLMFPIIALIFAASSLAGTIIGNSAKDVDNEGIKIALQSMAAGVTIIPLFITPIVMKAAGGFLGKVGAFVNNPNKGPFDRMRKGAQSYRQDRQNLRNRRAIEGKGMPGRSRFVRWRARKSAVSAGRESDLKRATTGYVADQAESNASFRNSLAGGTAFQDAGNASVARVLASAKAANTKQLMEEIDNLVATVDLDIKSNIPELKNRFDRAVQEGNVAHQAAYLKMMNANGSPGIEAMEESLTKRTQNTPYDDKSLMDLKDIMSGDSSFRSAGRSFEVWANNERSENAIDANGNAVLDSDGNQVKVPHANFSAVNNDPGVYKDISAQRFAGMSKPQQDKALTVLEQADAANGTKLAEALAKRVAADTTAMGSIKGVPQERIRTIIGPGGGP